MDNKLNNKDMFREIVKKIKNFNNSIKQSQTYGEYLFKGSSWYLLNKRSTIFNTKNTKNTNDEMNEEVINADEPLIVKSEKSEAIDALNEFVEKKLDQSPENRFKVTGGEIATKSNKSKTFTIDLSNLREEIPENTNENTLINNDFSDNNNILKVLFIGLKPKDITEEAARDESGCETDLLSKMIKATKIPANSYQKIYITKKTTVQEICKFIILQKPIYIVSLGAKATNLILNSQNKMTELHGKFIDLELIPNEIDLQNFNSIVMPLFHPDFLNINNGMKKLAWIDLQKLMKEIEQ